MLLVLLLLLLLSLKETRMLHFLTFHYLFPLPFDENLHFA